MSALTSAPPGDTRKGYARNIPIYYLFQFSSGFLIWVPIWIVFLINERGLSLTQVGIMEACFWGSIVIAEVPTGAIADRWGRRISLALGGLLFLISTLMFATLEGFAALACCWIVMAIAMTLYSGSGPALLFDTLRQLRRSREYERHFGRAQALATTAMLAATLLGGPFAALFGLQATILIGAGSMGVAGLIALLLREPPRREAEFEHDLFARPVGSGDLAESGSAPAVFQEMLVGFRIVWRNRPILWIILFAALIFVAFQMPNFFIQPFLLSFGIDPATDLSQGALFSALMVPALVCMILGALLAAPLVERLGERRALPILLMVGCAILVPMLFFNHLAIIAPIAALALLHSAVRPIATGYINRRIPSDQRATVLSIYELGYGALMMCIVPVVSASADIIDFRFAFGVSLTVLLTIGVALWLTWRRAHRRAQSDLVRNLSLRRAPQADGLWPSANGSYGNGVGAAAPAPVPATSSRDRI